MHRKTLGAAAICLLLTPLAAAPTDLVTTQGRHFVRGGQTFRFVGVNMRGLVHYGQASPLPFTSAADITTNLDGAQAMGAKVIRIFAANQAYTNSDNLARLTSVLDAMHARDMKAIVCFTDLYTTTYNPPGDASFYLPQPGGFTLLDDTWFTSGYTTNYLPWVQQVVTALKDHEGVFAWEIGNELTNIKTPNNIIPFTNAVAAAIKAIDPHHMVATGFISADHTQISIENAVALHNSPNIDFITLHTYNGDDPATNALLVSRVEKPLVIEEFGWATSSGDRVTNTSAQLAKWFDTRGAAGFMQWGAQYQNVDIGDGDNSVGFDRYAYPLADFNGIHALYSARATALAGAAGPVPPPDSEIPPGALNAALSAISVQTSTNFSPAFDGTKAVDGIVSAASKWASSGAALPQWIALDLGTERPIVQYTLRMASLAESPVGYALEDYAIQTAPSLSGPWTTRVSDNNGEQWGMRSYREATPFSARYVRLLINDAGIDAFVRLPEFEVWAQAPSQVTTWQLY